MTQAILASAETRVQVDASALTRLSHKGQTAVTTEMLADAYGCSAKNIRDNFSKNRCRFIEGKHFYSRPTDYHL